MNEDEISADCMARLERILEIDIPPLSRTIIKHLFVTAHRLGYSSGFERAQEIIDEEQA
jgi:hypothetical protein